MSKPYLPEHDKIPLAPELPYKLPPLPINYQENQLKKRISMQVYNLHHSISVKKSGSCDDNPDYLK